MAGPGDYTGITTGGLIFAPILDERQCFPVAIIDDSLVEGPEVFAVRLILDPLFESIVLVNDRANITIMDNDGKLSELLMSYSNCNILIIHSSYKNRLSQGDKTIIGKYNTEI